jgi:hypothetical protein
MSVSQYYEMLTKALHKLHLEFGGRDAWEMIIEESGVYNVKDIAEGRIKPSLESWQQLHIAFPDKIPPP